MFPKKQAALIMTDKPIIISTPQPLLVALSEIYHGASNNTLKNLLKNRRISINGTPVLKGSHELQAGDILTITPAYRKISGGIEIIYEDKDLVIINKPEGLLCVPLDTGSAMHALGILRRHYHNSPVWAVHRIDRETSGIMIFARNDASFSRLKDMFKNHDFIRTYIGIVLGALTEQKGTWKSYLTEVNECEVISTNEPHNGKLAITHFETISQTPNYTFLKIRLETGRKHQIRVHCRENRHPIVGDRKYCIPLADPIHRLCLHAYCLEFSHPSSGKPMSFYAPLPQQFAALGLPDKKLRTL